MLGLVLLYFIGKYFYDLALNHSKNGWIFAISGIVVYYAGTFIGGIIMALVYIFGFHENIENENNLIISLIAIPFGIAACWGFYAILKWSWNRPANKFGEDVLDENMNG